MDKHIKGVFFDLYGTLLVFKNFDKANEDWENAFYEIICKQHGLDFSDCKNLCRDILANNIEKDLLRGLTTYETKIQTGLEKFGVVLSLEELRTAADDTVGAWQKEIVFAEDVFFVIDQLKKNNVVGLVTNFDHTPHIKKILAEAGLNKMFDFVIISDEVGFIKPDPKIFELALAKTNLNAKEVLFVGDNIHDDIKGAASVGINPVLISRNSKSHYIHDKDLPHEKLLDYRIINSLSELLEI